MGGWDAGQCMVGLPVDGGPGPEVAYNRFVLETAM